MLGEYLSAEWIDFAEGNGFKPARAFQPEREAANAGKEIKNTQLLHTALHGSECCTVQGVYVRIELAGERPREDERTPPAFASTGQGDPRSELVSEIPLSRN